VTYVIDLGLFILLVAAWILLCRRIRKGRMEEWHTYQVCACGWRGRLPNGSYIMRNCPLCFSDEMEVEDGRLLHGEWEAKGEML